MSNLYSRFKIFHYKEKLDSLPEAVDRILPPLHIRLKPTNACNQRCWYCAYRLDDVQLGKDMDVRSQMPRQKMLELIEDFQEMGIKAITFSGGGEPLCYPYLGEALSGLAGSGIKFASLTNGALLHGAIANLFAHHGSWIRVSMDGWDADSYATYRNVSSREYGKVMANLENFKKLGGHCFLSVIVNVDKTNATHVYEIIKRLNAVGVDSVKIAPCVFSDDIQVTHSYHGDIFPIVQEQIHTAMGDLASETFEISNGYNVQLAKFVKSYRWCPSIQITPVIGADLNVYSCQDKAYNFTSGVICSIKELRFKDAWLTGKKQFFRIDPSCHCNHHCVADEKNKMILDYLEVDKRHLEFV
jgi:MoaA/NifB/PqqE/SkfB family radical SAM enzyme